jgi:hypothetical protein
MEELQSCQLQWVFSFALYTIVEQCTSGMKRLKHAVIAIMSARINARRETTIKIMKYNDKQPIYYVAQLSKSLRY